MHRLIARLARGARPATRRPNVAPAFAGTAARPFSTRGGPVADAGAEEVFTSRTRACGAGSPQKGASGVGRGERARERRELPRWERFGSASGWHGLASRDAASDQSSETKKRSGNGIRGLHAFGSLLAL